MGSKHNYFIPNSTVNGYNLSTSAMKIYIIIIHDVLILEFYISLVDSLVVVKLMNPNATL